MDCTFATGGVFTIARVCRVQRWLNSRKPASAGVCGTTGRMEVAMTSTLPESERILSRKDPRYFVATRVSPDRRGVHEHRSTVGRCGRDRPHGAYKSIAAAKTASLVLMSSSASVAELDWSQGYSGIVKFGMARTRSVTYASRARLCETLRKCSPNADGGTHRLRYWWLHAYVYVHA